MQDDVFERVALQFARQSAACKGTDFKARVQNLYKRRSGSKAVFTEGLMRYIFAGEELKSALGQEVISAGLQLKLTQHQLDLLLDIYLRLQICPDPLKLALFLRLDQLTCPSQDDPRQASLSSLLPLFVGHLLKDRRFSQQLLPLAANLFKRLVESKPLETSLLRLLTVTSPLLLREQLCYQRQGILQTAVKFITKVHERSQLSDMPPGEWWEGLLDLLVKCGVGVYFHMPRECLTLPLCAIQLVPLGQYAEYCPDPLLGLLASMLKRKQAADYLARLGLSLADQGLLAEGRVEHLLGCMFIFRLLSFILEHACKENLGQLVQQLQHLAACNNGNLWLAQLFKAAPCCWKVLLDCPPLFQMCSDLSKLQLVRIYRGTYQQADINSGIKRSALKLLLSDCQQLEQLSLSQTQIVEMARPLVQSLADLSPFRTDKAANLDLWLAIVEECMLRASDLQLVSFIDFETLGTDLHAVKLLTLVLARHDSSLLLAESSLQAIHRFLTTLALPVEGPSLDACFELFAVWQPWTSFDLCPLLFSQVKSQQSETVSRFVAWYKQLSNKQPRTVFLKTGSGPSLHCGPLLRLGLYFSLSHQSHSEFHTVFVSIVGKYSLVQMQTELLNFDPSVIFNGLFQICAGRQQPILIKLLFTTAKYIPAKLAYEYFSLLSQASPDIKKTQLFLHLLQQILKGIMLNKTEPVELRQRFGQSWVTASKDLPRLQHYSAFITELPTPLPLFYCDFGEVQSWLQSSKGRAHLRHRVQGSSLQMNSYKSILQVGEYQFQICSQRRGDRRTVEGGFELDFKDCRLTAKQHSECVDITLEFQLDLPAELQLTTERDNRVRLACGTVVLMLRGPSEFRVRGLRTASGLRGEANGQTLQPNVGYRTKLQKYLIIRGISVKLKDLLEEENDQSLKRRIVGFLAGLILASVALQDRTQLPLSEFIVHRHLLLDVISCCEGVRAQFSSSWKQMKPVLEASPKLPYEVFGYFWGVLQLQARSKQVVLEAIAVLQTQLANPKFQQSFEEQGLARQIIHLLEFGPNYRAFSLQDRVEVRRATVLLLQTICELTILHLLSDRTVLFLFEYFKRVAGKCPRRKSSDSHDLEVLTAYHEFQRKVLENCFATLLQNRMQLLVHFRKQTNQRERGLQPEQVRFLFGQLKDFGLVLKGCFLQFQWDQLFRSNVIDLFYSSQDLALRYPELSGHFCNVFSFLARSVAYLPRESRQVIVVHLAAVTMSHAFAFHPQILSGFSFILTVLAQQGANQLSIKLVRQLLRCVFQQRVDLAFASLTNLLANFGPKQSKLVLHELSCSWQKKLIPFGLQNALLNTLYNCLRLQRLEGCSELLAIMEIVLSRGECEQFRYSLTPKQCGPQLVQGFLKSTQRRVRLNLPDAHLAVLMLFSCIEQFEHEDQCGRLLLTALQLKECGPLREQDSEIAFLTKFQKASTIRICQLVYFWAKKTLSQVQCTDLKTAVLKKVQARGQLAVEKLPVRKKEKGLQAGLLSKYPQLFFDGYLQTTSDEVPQHVQSYIFLDSANYFHCKNSPFWNSCDPEDRRLSELGSMQTFKSEYEETRKRQQEVGAVLWAKFRKQVLRRQNSFFYQQQKAAGSTVLRQKNLYDSEFRGLVFVPEEEFKYTLRDSVLRGTVQSQDCQMMSLLQNSKFREQQTQGETTIEPVSVQDVDSDCEEDQFKYLPRQGRVGKAGQHYPCERVGRKGVLHGRLVIHETALLFLGGGVGPQFQAKLYTSADGMVSKVASSCVMHFADIKQIVPRRYNQANGIACEVRTYRGKAYFFNFADSARKTLFQSELTEKMDKKKTVSKESMSLRLDKLVRRWCTGEISNFLFLGELNFLASRSFNDLSQYPVFPFVLSDFQSAQLKLQSKDCFRNLAVPIGALYQPKVKRLEARMSQVEGKPGMRSFYYGSHYSTIGSVSYFLIRIEPYTSVHYQLQGGRFDLADRLFASVAQFWKSIETNLAQVKEAIPEFYYLPLFLRNKGGIKLGVKQDKQQVKDVKLPAWARSPQQFILQMRLALESEYVDKTLNRWVDLVFGCRQRSHADKNTFYPLTYEQEANLKQAEPDLVLCLKAQIAYFGQCPPRLFQGRVRERLPVQLPKGPFWRQRSVLVLDRLHSLSLSQNRLKVAYEWNGRVICLDIRLESEEEVKKTKYQQELTQGRLPIAVRFAGEKVVLVYRDEVYKYICGWETALDSTRAAAICCQQQFLLAEDGLYFIGANKLTGRRLLNWQPQRWMAASSNDYQVVLIDHNSNLRLLLFLNCYIAKEVSKLSSFPLGLELGSQNIALVWQEEVEVIDFNGVQKCRIKVAGVKELKFGLYDSCLVLLLASGRLLKYQHLLAKPCECEVAVRPRHHLAYFEDSAFEVMAWQEKDCLLVRHRSKLKRQELSILPQ